MADDSAFVMDLSRRRLTSRGLTEALGRLVGVLAEDEGPATDYLPRPLDLCAARNDVTRFELPIPSLEEEEPAETETETEVASDAGGMMEMMMGWRDQQPSSPSSVKSARKKLAPIEDRLTRLDMSRNRLGPRASDFAGLWRLTALDLSSNRLSSARGLEAVTALRDLSLRDNVLRDLEGLGALTALGRLDVAANALAGVPSLRPLAMKGAVLRDLDISANPLCDRDPGQLRRALREIFPRLRRLRGLADHPDDLVTPASRRHDSYVDVHKRRAASPLPRRVADCPRPADFPATAARSLVPPPRPPSPRRPRRRDDDDATWTTRDASALPWRRPPNPVPRWMLERTVGTEAATAVLRRTSQRPHNHHHHHHHHHHPGTTRHDTPNRRRLDDHHTNQDDDDDDDESGPSNILEALEQIVRCQRGEFGRRRQSTISSTASM